MRRSLLRLLPVDPPQVSKEVEKLFGEHVDLFSTGASGVATVATTFDTPGPLKEDVEVHSPTCGIFRTRCPLDCTCGWYHPVALGKP